MKHCKLYLATLASAMLATWLPTSAQSVIPLPPATVTTPDADPADSETEVFTIGDLLDSDDAPATPDAVAVEDESLLTETEPTKPIDPLADFPERLAAERERLEQPLEINTDIDVSNQLLPRLFYLPVVFKPYDITLRSPYGDVTTPAEAQPKSLGNELEWVNSLLSRHQDMEATIQQFAVAYPWTVKYNQESLPEVPKRYYAAIDPKTATITVREVNPDMASATSDITLGEIKKKHWLHTFVGSLHFSQAYISPNWYQGGNNNLNLIGDLKWNVKLNPAYHPKLLFETTVQYRLAINNAPDDSLRSYSISQDLFQINSNFGLKASNNWYYSASLLFKTQLLNNYPTNSTALKAAFLSPGELNLGLGMTYSKTYPKGSLNVSINPLSYNLKMCLNSRVDETSLGLKAGHKTLSQYGSNVEVKFDWKLAYNIKYATRVYAFTNYSYVQGDWENTLSFDINRFLSTQIFVHLRYDSSAKRLEDTSWHTWQLKEILSFGFTYNFSTI
ncbi:MAG: DUF3078 domain-containing protein [Muribaculaceae bacterium]|nr:DUF3078 domain-containing protein [Muribaculaceae bacterium]